MLESSLVQAEALRRALILAAGAREHAMVVGPPGVAKTDAVKEFFHDIARSSCSIACTADTLSDGIVGSINPKVLLEQGLIEFISGPSLLNSEFVHLDEFADLSDEIQTLVLGPLQPGPDGKRIFTRAGKEVQLPLEMVIATGNSWPKREAVRDRFAVQYPVEPAETERVLSWALGTRPPRTSRGIWDDIQRLREAADGVEIDPGLVAAIALAAREFKLTMRRVVQYTVKVLKVNAALEGRAVAGFEDLAQTLPYLVQADSQEEFQKAADWVRIKAAQLRADASFLEIKKKFQSLNRRKLSQMDAFKGYRELLRAIGAVDPDECSDPTKVRSFIAELDGVVQKRREELVQLTLNEAEKDPT